MIIYNDSRPLNFGHDCVHVELMSLDDVGFIPYFTSVFLLFTFCVCNILLYAYFTNFSPLVSRYLFFICSVL